MVRSFPKQIYIEVTRKCNLRCEMCPHSFSEIDRRDIDPRVLEAIRPLLELRPTLSLHGLGEGLMTKRFFEILASIPAEHDTRLITNGILLTEEKCRLLVEHGLSVCTFSIDAINPQTYRFVHGSEAFDKVIEHVEMLQRIKKEMNSELPLVTFSFTAMEANIEELPGYVRLAARLGAHSVGGSYLAVFRESLRDQSLVHHRERSNRALTEAREAARDEGIEFYFPDPFDLGADPWDNTVAKESSPCREPWETVFIANDGTVRACCIHEEVLGDLNTESFDQVWNGERYRSFRAAVNTERKRGMCRTCVDWRYRNVDKGENHIVILSE